MLYQIKKAFEKFTGFFYGITFMDLVKVAFFILIVVNIVANGFSGGGENTASGN